jgi:ubiquinone/menaquinone biosynthesis C-methylase UbiE
MNKEEIERIRKVYQSRLDLDVVRRYSLLHPGELFIAQDRERKMLKLLLQHGVFDLSSVRILEVGCGRGLRILDWLRWGARPSNLVGIDLMEQFLREAVKILPSARFAVASGTHLPFRQGEFDLVTQLTVFSSILDPVMRQQVAAEMLRAVKPGGFLLWYDFRYRNPRNRNVRPVGHREIRRLFPDCTVVLRSLTLAPPLARRFAQLSFLLCAVLNLIPVLRTHYLALIRKPEP